jgi:hypothetical protein
VSETDIQTSLLEEIEGTLGTGSATSRLRLLEAILKPMYESLPKNEFGNLGHATVRYALHRLFIMRHGWSIKGLGRHAEDANVSSLGGVFKDQVPAYIQDTFEKRLGEKGVGLRELAVMASTLEHLIHRETVGKLGDVYNLLQILPTTRVSKATSYDLLDTYMMAFILAQDARNLTLNEAQALMRGMPELFLAWGETQEFVRRIHSNITQVADDAPSPMLEFSSVAKVAEVIGEEYGSFQNFECQQLKGTLMKMEFAGSGRVKLADFYKPALGGGWQFQESVGYLRQLGALDESDPNSMSVIIVNYLHSQTNCIAASGYYSVCCIDECEALFGHLEEKILASEAKPAAIAALVESISSPTVNSSRKLSAKLLTFLDDIAAFHGGRIPLHGRLFAQWMHHAYPRECPYPHMSGTTRQQTENEWMLDTGADSVATEEEMRQITDVTLAIKEDSDEVLMPWSFEEELLVSCKQENVDANSPFARLRPFVLVALACLLACSLVHTLRSSTLADRHDVGNAKFMV